MWGYTAFTPKGYISCRGVYADGYGEGFFKLPYQPGDILYVRETWGHPISLNSDKQYVFRADKIAESGFKNDSHIWHPSKRLCLTFSVYYFVHPYNITALMICQHVFLNIYIFYRKIVTENGVNSNESSVFSLLYIQYFLHIRAIIKVSQQFITTQPLHEMAD